MGTLRSDCMSPFFFLSENRRKVEIHDKVSKVEVLTIPKPPNIRQFLLRGILKLNLCHFIQPIILFPIQHPFTRQHTGPLLAIPLTSAPAEKKRPSPVSTVKIVSGCSFNTRSAAMVSAMRLPPKELRALGRLN